MSESSKNKSLLDHFHLGDRYERKARLAPALLSVVFLFPMVMAYGVATSSWISTIVAGTGFSAVIAIGLSYLSSAMGNSFQKQLWPNWPHDSPTNAWLRPDNHERSLQQKQLWWSALKKLTSLDLEGVDPNDLELRLRINDAVGEIRARLSGTDSAKRLQRCNEDYGFARNFAGFRFFWLFFSAASVVGTWGAVFALQAEIIWAVLASLLLVFALFLDFALLTPYVKSRAAQYAEAFFSALMTLSNGVVDSEQE